LVEFGGRIMSTNGYNTQIPYLPGNSIRVLKKNNAKSHVWDIQNGSQVLNETVTAPLGQQEADLSIAQYSPEFDATQQSIQTDNVGLRRVPTWVKYDKKVLRYFCYFKEAVVSSNIETYRVRKCVLYYYLEDHSMHIAEPKEENSGIPQGVFCKRHRIAGPDNKFISWEDLKIQNEVMIYGRVFRIYDADQATRDFLAQHMGRDLGAPEEVPRDTFNMKHSSKAGNHNKIMYPMKKHMEASLGKMMSLDIKASQKFLMNDRKVLRFYCVWENPKFFGEQRPFVLHYFLANDNVEVLDVSQPNSGRDQFPTFLKRQKLPKDFRKTCPDISKIGHTDKSVQYYKDVDLRIGTSINVYGRELMICNCDDFTKNHYMVNYGMTEDQFEDLLQPELETNVPKLEPPPHNGYGTDEDSLGSFLYLMPKVPKINYKKLMENDKNILNFSAKFKDASPEDIDRRFNIRFYLSVDKISIFENFKRNSGFIGGKFLERSRVLNPRTNYYFQPSDFKVGETVTINKHNFELIDCTEWTKNFMLEKPELFQPEQVQSQLVENEVEM